MARFRYLAAGLLSLAIPASAQDSPVKGARVTLAPRSIAVERVTLENRRDTQLVAFQVGVFPPGTATPSKTYWADFTVGGAPAHGAIAPKGRTSFDIDVSDAAEATSVAIVLAQFADGNCEGRVPAAGSTFTLRMSCAHTAGTVTSVVATSQRVASSKTVALLENLRDVPIEAFGLETGRPGGAPSGGVVEDRCCMPADVPPPFGPIQSREARALDSWPQLGPGEELRLSFVLFGDGVFEGRSGHRDEMLRRREQLAEAHAFAVDVLQQAVALPEADVIPFLEKHRAEWVRDARAAGRRGDDATALYDAIAEARRQPAAFALFVKGFVEMLEAQRQQLLRHKRRS